MVETCRIGMKEHMLYTAGGFNKLYQSLCIDTETVYTSRIGQYIGSDQHSSP